MPTRRADADSLQAEMRRTAALSQEQLVASTRWLPLCSPSVDTAGLS